MATRYFNKYRVTTLIDNKLLDELDKYREKKGKSESEALRDILTRALIEKDGVAQSPWI